LAFQSAIHCHYLRFIVRSNRFSLKSGDAISRQSRVAFRELHAPDGGADGTSPTGDDGPWMRIKRFELAGAPFEPEQDHRLRRLAWTRLVGAGAEHLTKSAEPQAASEPRS
jgi:hypothetical protein